jgi:hypothetical protein
MMLTRCVMVALLSTLVSGPPAPVAARLPGTVEDAIQQVTPDELRGYVTVLASDSLAGRGVGHPGNQQAEAYIVASLKNANVPPATFGYLQPVEVYQPILGQGARLTVRAGGETLADLAAGADFVPLPESGDRAATGPLVFAGHGLSAPELDYDDYSRVDANGAIVVVLDDAPEAIRRMPSLSADDRADIGGIDRKIRDARAHGGIRAASNTSGLSTPRCAPRITGCTAKCVHSPSRSRPCPSTRPDRFGTPSSAGRP